MATVFFTSSSTFMDNPDEPMSCDSAEVEITDYIEGTYDRLRRGPNGDEIAFFENGAWTLSDGTGRRFSDWAVSV